MAKDLGMEEAIQKLRERKSQAKGAAGEQKISDLHQKGLLTARERIEALLDPGTFCEQYPFAETIGRDFGLDRKRYPGDGAIVGWGGIDGQRVYVTANDGLIMGGSGSSTHIRKLALTIDQAVKNGSPLIQLNDSSGGEFRKGRTRPLLRSRFFTATSRPPESYPRSRPLWAAAQGTPSTARP